MVGVAFDARSRADGRVKRARASRVSAGHVVMLLAGLLGALLTIAALRSADHRVDVLVARGDLVPGAVVREGDLRPVRINGDASAMAALVRATDARDLVGRIVTTRVRAGRFVARDDVQVARGRRAGRSMSFPIDKARALDGRLVAGDRVDVIAVESRTGAPRYVATGVEVLRVGGDASRGPLAASSSVTVTLAVDADGALDLAAAMHEKDLTLVRATGAAPIGVDS